MLYTKSKTWPYLSHNLVQSFYESDEGSWMRLGRKVYVSVRQAEKQVHVKKTWYWVIPSLLASLKSLNFLQSSVFWLGQVIHIQFVPASSIKNVKLMMVGGKIADLTVHEDIPLRSYMYIRCHAQVACNPPQPSSYLRTCHSCPGVSMLKDRLKLLIDENLIDTVIYIQAAGLCWQLHPWNFQKIFRCFCGWYFLRS